MVNKSLTKDIKFSSFVRKFALGFFMVCGLLISFSATAADIQQVTAEQVRDIIESDKPLIIVDIRTPAEFEAGHIAGAINVDFLDVNFHENIKKLVASSDKEKPWVLYCRSGNRSSLALPIIEHEVKGRVYHMNQGIVSWQFELVK